MSDDFKNAIAKSIEELGLDEETYKDIFNVALTTTLEDLAQLKTAIDANDLKGIAELGHKMKGTFGNMRLDDLANLATKLEALSKNNGSIDDLMGVYNQFQESFQKLSETLK